MSEVNCELVEIDLGYVSKLDDLQSDIEKLPIVENKKYTFLKNNLKQICALHSLISFLIGISSVIVGAYIFNPDYVDPIGINVASYVFFNGAADITGAVITFFIGCVYADVGRTRRGIWIWTSIRISFGLAWFIIGSVILFRSNLELLKTGSVITSYGLFVWCLNIVSGFTI